MFREYLCSSRHKGNREGLARVEKRFAMAYLTIGNEPVFLTRSKYGEVVRVTTGLPSKGVLIDGGNGEPKEVTSRMAAALGSKYTADPERFHREWVEFDLLGDEALHNTWDLLCDHCSLYGYAKPTDLSSFQAQRKDDLDEGDGSMDPMGRVLALDHHLPSNRPLQGFYDKIISRKGTGRTVRVVIALSTVKRLLGSLSSFTIFVPGLRIACGENLEILPNISSLDEVSKKEVCRYLWANSEELERAEELAYRGPSK